MNRAALVLFLLTPMGLAGADDRTPDPPADRGPVTLTDEARQVHREALEGPLSDRPDDRTSINRRRVQENIA